MDPGQITFVVSLKLSKELSPDGDFTRQVCIRLMLHLSVNIMEKKKEKTVPFLFIIFSQKETEQHKSEG